MKKSSIANLLYVPEDLTNDNNTQNVAIVPTTTTTTTSTIPPMAQMSESINTSKAIDLGERKIIKLAILICLRDIDTLAKKNKNVSTSNTIRKKLVSEGFNITQERVASNLQVLYNHKFIDGEKTQNFLKYAIIQKGIAFIESNSVTLEQLRKTYEKYKMDYVCDEVDYSILKFINTKPTNSYHGIIIEAMKNKRSATTINLRLRALVDNDFCERVEQFNGSDRRVFYKILEKGEKALQENKSAEKVKRRRAEEETSHNSDVNNNVDLPRFIWYQGPRKIGQELLITDEENHIPVTENNSNVPQLK